MQDLKTGHLIRASPRAQFYGQLIGSFLSIIVTATAYTLYNRAYQIPGPSFPAPTAYVWLGLARLLRMLRVIFHIGQVILILYVSTGDGDLPEKSNVFMLSFAIRETQMTPTGPLRIASTEENLFVNIQKVFHLFVRQVYQRHVCCDKRFRQHLNKN